MSPGGLHAIPMAAHALHGIEVTRDDGRQLGLYNVTPGAALAAGMAFVRNRAASDPLLDRLPPEFRDEHVRRCRVVSKLMEATCLYVRDGERLVPASNVHPASARNDDVEWFQHLQAYKYSVATTAQVRLQYSPTNAGVEVEVRDLATIDDCTYAATCIGDAGSARLADVARLQPYYTSHPPLIGNLDDTYIDAVSIGSTSLIVLMDNEIS